MPLAFDELPAVVIRERTWIPHELIISPERVKADLTLTNGAVAAARARGFPLAEGAVEEFVLFEETEGYLIVPRAFPVPLKGRRGVDYRVVDLTGRRGILFADDLVQLGPNQWQRFDQAPAFAAMTTPDVMPHGRMLVLRCGAGKTAIALKAAAQRNGRTLWVTVTDALVDQAREAITRYLGVPDKEIGRAHGGRLRWEGLGIATATIQTLAQADLPRAFYEYWDLIIFDEGDVLGAPLFHRAVPRFRGERWVLTATPKRSDGNERLFEMHTGPACYTHTEFDLVPECYFIPTSASERLAVHRGYDFVHKRPRLQHALTARNLLCDEERQDLLLGEVLKATRKGRTVLVVGDSIEGVGMLRQRGVTLGIEDSAVITSRTGKLERREAIKTPQVVFATSGIFKRGLDRVVFDTLVLASMVTVNDTFNRQLCGRILRYNPDNPDKRPIVVVPVDVNIEPLRMMAAQLAYRFKAYKWPTFGLAKKLLDERAASRRRR